MNEHRKLNFKLLSLKGKVLNWRGKMEAWPIFEYITGLLATCSRNKFRSLGPKKSAKDQQQQMSAIAIELPEIGGRFSVPYHPICCLLWFELWQVQKSKSHQGF